MEESNFQISFNTHIPSAKLKVGIVFRLIKEFILYMGDHRANAEFTESVNAYGLFFIDPDGPAFHDVEQQKIGAIIQIIIRAVHGSGCAGGKQDLPVYRLPAYCPLI